MSRSFDMDAFDCGAVMALQEFRTLLANWEDLDLEDEAVLDVVLGILNLLDSCIEKVKAESSKQVLRSDDSDSA